MTYTYDLQCGICAKKVGEVSFGNEPNKEVLERSLSGYICETCMKEMQVEQNQPQE